MKNIDWANLVVAIMDRLIISQAELATRCKVAQQTVSTWKKGTRTPSVLARRQLMEFAGAAELNLIFFSRSVADGEESGSGDDVPEHGGRVAGTMEEGAEYCPQATEFVTVLQQLPPNIAEEVLEYARLKLDLHRRMNIEPNRH
jgi:transcriptional regulator with XRE-family HTH domain